MEAQAAWQRLVWAAMVRKSAVTRCRSWAAVRAFLAAFTASGATEETEPVVAAPIVPKVEHPGRIRRAATRARRFMASPIGLLCTAPRWRLRLPG